MNSLIQTNVPVTMSSQEIADLVNSRHDDVKRSIRRLADKGVIQLPPTAEVKNHLGQTVEVYQFGKRDSYVIVAQLSPEFTARLVDRWQELEQAAASPRLLTTTETLIQMLQLQAEVERRQMEHEERLTVIDEKVERIETAQTVMSGCPSNAESITHLRERIGKMFGLSASTVDQVMRQSPYTPKPAGVVRNNHVDADNSTYTVWWKKDVTKLFHRFANECKQLSDQFYTHPFVEGRFKMVLKD